MSIKFMNLVGGECYCPPCGSSCNVKIDGYYDGFFNFCAECDISIHPPWPGTLVWPSSGGNVCGALGLFSLSGHNLAQALISGVLTPSHTLFIQCAFTSTGIMWTGVKTGTPGDITGVYVRSDGCDLSPTVTVVPI